MKTWDFMEEFTKDFTEQLKQDDARWGDTWLKRTKRGQTERTFPQWKKWQDQFENRAIPIPWLQVIGDAYINWIREKHPEVWPE